MDNIIDFINLHRDRYLDELKALLAARAPLYATAAQTVDTSSAELDEVVERVIHRVK